MEEATLFECIYCNKSYSTKSNRDRHIKTMHKEDLVPELATTKTSRIRCILCCVDQVIAMFSTYKDYNKHLEDTHQVIVHASTWQFTGKEEYDLWREKDKRDVNYAYKGDFKSQNKKHVYYNCNRTDSRGFQSTSKKRMTKTGGTIKISGACPSRMIVSFDENGRVTVKFFETHVGHEEEVRAQHLSKKEQTYLVDQLKTGVNKERIISNARNFNLSASGLPGRLNTITRQDLQNLSKRYNVDHIRHQNDMIATAMKVDEWNANGRNCAFLFKQIGDSSHPLLGMNDFALAYMNPVMERKLEDFSRIICMDGTHGLTKYRQWELTIMLVKDDTQAGFPVAFLLSNRKDQLILEVFLDALRNKLGHPIMADYIMSDDDPRYYNAWLKTMEGTPTPAKLLCTWHVIKNWNIQGKKKIQNLELRKSMKVDLRKVLKATTEDKFVKASLDYFKKIEGETVFMEYLRKHYYSGDHRIRSWAHCYRTNVGINTNMALESLNRYIKKEKLQGEANVRIEKLLNVLEEVVEDKMWKRIISIQRPNRNSYQGRKVAAAHRKAEELLEMELVEMESAGKYKVGKVDHLYNVHFKSTCSFNCKNMYCDSCQICFHSFSCSCYEYCIKTSTCKHIHAAAMYEKRGQILYVPDNIDDDVVQSASVDNRTEEIEEFLLEKRNETQGINSDEEGQTTREHWANFMNEMFALNGKAYDVFDRLMNSVELEMRQTLGQTTKKRKLDHQQYFPDKKKHI